MRAIIENSLRSLLFLMVALAALSAGAQQQATVPAAETDADLGRKIEALTRTIQQMQSELEESRAEIRELRQEISQTIRKEASGQPPTAASTAPMPDQAQGAQQAPPAHISQDDWQILNARVEEHEQVKVESSSKYRLKLSGIALMNVFDTAGHLDNFDAPTAAVQAAFPGYNGSIGASFRQSILGLRGLGPAVFGASTSADLQLDFINGGAGPYNGAAAGLVGLRTAELRFDWSNFSVSGGLEAPFFSPNSPTSYLSLAVPAFAGAGNLWNWTPQIRAERRFDFTSSEVKLEAGVLDPAGYSVGAANVRVPTPGESSRQPMYAIRLSGNNRMEDHGISFGVSGIYSPLRFANGQVVSASAAISDWKFPLMPKLQLSGAFFFGKGLDGFGGLPLLSIQPQDYLHYAYVTAPALAMLPVMGGWSQLKFTLNSRSEFNAAAGVGARNPRRLRDASRLDPLLISVPPNNGAFFFNYIFRPRGDLLFSAEYRRFQTNELQGRENTAGQIGLAAGFLF